MRESIITLTTLFIIVASCGTETKVEDEFQPYRVGTWMIASPDSSVWVGSDTKNKSLMPSLASHDTLVFESPSSNALTYTKDAEGEGTLVYIDSTITFPEYEGYRIYELANWKPVNPLRIDPGRNTMNADRWYITFIVQYSCESDQEISDSLLDKFMFHIVNDQNSDTLRSLKFEVSGFVETTETLLCS